MSTSEASARVRVGVCSVGAELLSGEIADTNAAWLLQRVEETGAAAAVTLMVGDALDEIMSALQWLSERADVIIVSGGLGPTSDDLTRYAVAAFAGVAVERREELVQHLDARYRSVGRPLTEDALRQAEIPEGAEHHAPLGTAAGFSMSVEAPILEGDITGCPTRTVLLHVLPGVPWEFKGSVEAHVLPGLTAAAGGVAKVTRTAHIAGMGESSIATTLRPISDRIVAAQGSAADPEQGIGIAFLARSDEVLVKVAATGSSPTDARERASRVFDECLRSLGAAVTSIDDRRVEDEVVDLLVELDRSVATVEGVTAGRVAGLLTTPEDPDEHFRGGQLVPDRLDRLERTSLSADARRIIAETGADYAVVTAGVIEPRLGTVDRPVGSIAWLISGPDGLIEFEERTIPALDREILRARTAAFAVEALRRILLLERFDGGLTTDG